MEHGHEIDTLILLHNNSPLQEFLGLSLNQMHSLLYETFTADSPVQLSNDIDEGTLDQIPLFLIGEAVMKVIEREQQIKLTPLGALPKKVVVEVYDKRFLIDELIAKGIYKLWREEDCITVLNARLACTAAGLIKKVNGKLTLTKKGAKLLAPGCRVQLFHNFFEGFTTKLLWSFNDGYPEGQAGQLGWAFSILLLHKFEGEERPVAFYADKYLKAFPEFIHRFGNSYNSPEDEFTRCYTCRVFTRFMIWFGFAKIEGEKEYSYKENRKVRSTAIFPGIFKFDVE